MTKLDGVLLLEPSVVEDERGYFLESWNRRRFEKAVGADVEFVQDNHSRSAYGVLRGLHYQMPPAVQGKLVRCVNGAVWDVAVDIRRSSPTFGAWFGVELTEQNKHQIWIPPGFAHGFVALTETADLLYKASGYYSPACDRSIRWDDPAIGIDWPLPRSPILSEKDSTAPVLSEAETFA